jgi:solute carrier family 25 phosphate transporter 3
MYDTMGKTPKECSGGTNLSVSLGSGVVAGVIAAIISHPADTLLSKVNKPGAGGEGSAIKRMGVIAAETGYLKLCTQGLAARCIMVRARTHTHTRSGIVSHDKSNHLNSSFVNSPSHLKCV